MKLSLPSSLPQWRPSKGQRRAASGTSLALVATALVALAVNADGSPVTDVELHDGSVWVSNSQRLLAGRLNPQIKQLDLGVSTDSGQVDIFQNGPTVFVDSQGTPRTLRAVDVATSTSSDPVELPETLDAAFGGQTIAMLDLKTGQAWVQTAANIGGFSAKASQEAIKVARDGAVAVSPAGVAYVLDRTSGEVTSFAVDENGQPVQQEVVDLGESLGEKVQLSVVGSTPVAYDENNGTLYRPGAEPVKVPSEDPELVRLQQPSAQGETVYVAGVEGLWTASPGGGDLTKVKRPEVNGRPAAPVVMDGCVHAAWADPEAKSYSRLCDGEEDFHKAIPQVSAGADLVFRSNRKVVVLNDVVSGDSWLVQRDSLDIVNNWDDVDPNTKKQELEKQKLEEVEEQEQNRPPVANPDTLGARPGQSTILPVVLNDTDPDRDIITITKVVHASGPEPVGGYAVVGNDTQVQATYPAGATGQSTFTYDISDGRGGTASAQATVVLRGEGENLAPVKLTDRNTTLYVGQGQRSSVFMLQDWVDPDGDDLTVVDAKPQGGGEVQFRADGTVEYLDTDGQAGKTGIEVTVSDGRDQQVTTVLPVEVVGAAQAKPQLTPDRTAGSAGKKILVEPLVNDANPMGTPLMLSDVTQLDGVEIVKDPVGGTFTALAAKPGTYYLRYSAANDDQTAESVVRLDVKADQGVNVPPVAVKDKGTLPTGGSVLVDLLSNDYDADEDVLVVQGVSVDRTVPLKVSLIDKQMVRVEATGDLTAPAQFTYQVSDGEATVEGAVSVSPGTALEANRAPVLNEDHQTMRANSVASIDVLDNDSDPDGDALSLLQEDIVLDEAATNAGLVAFVSGDAIKVRAPEQAGSYALTYGVRDARGVRVASTIWLTVKPDTAESNGVPQPAPIIDRAITGESIRIPLNVQGSDPDGDAVGFKSVVLAPQMGRIVATGADWLEYEALEGQVGTEVFTVAVEDKYGGRGNAEVRIGVVPPSSANQPPVALNDELLVRPGKQIQYDPRINDSDPDGDAPVVQEGLSAPADSGAKLAGQFVELTAPDTKDGMDAGVSVGYTITDGLGGQDTGFLTVTASDLAPLHAPIVRDDSAELSEVTGKKPGDKATIDVLENDGDLDGRLEDLEIEAVDGDVSRVKGRKIEVTLAETDQVVVYKVTDGDDQEAFGFVFVSGTNSAPPALDPEKIPATTKANTPLTIDLDSYVLVRPGRTPILTTTDTFDAQHDDGSALNVEGDDTKLVFTPEKDYVGPASITFEVTDGESLNDPDGLTSLLTIPIDVTPVDNVPPTFRNLTMTVADDGKAAELPLQPAAKDANKDKLSFEVAASDGPLSAEITSGSTLSVTANDEAKPGDTGTVDITVSDGTAEVSGQVLVTISSTARPLVRIAPIELEGTAGEAITIDVADYATNPYPDESLKLSSVGLEGGDASSPDVSGTKITVTPKKDTSGVVTVKFTVSDASGDSVRDVVGRAKVIVAGRPEAPGKPQVTTTEARSAVLTWSAPNDRGAPITSYKVSGSNGFSQECQSTTCTLEGLNPGDQYTFTVVAVNKIGESDPSAASSPVTPDKMPDVMAPPQIADEPKKMDKQLSLSWTKPGNEGSEISSYEIKLVGSGQTQTVSGGATSYTWGGLENGKTYQFQIRAINKTPTQQQFSPSSAAVAPFGKPTKMAAPTATAPNSGTKGDGKTIKATWVAPKDNGDPISGYRLVTYRDGAQWKVEEISAGQTSKQYDNVDNGVDYSFSVEAENRAGYSDPSAKSNAVNPYGPASAPKITGHGDEYDASNNACVTINFTTPKDNGGRPVVAYSVEWRGGDARINAPTQAENASTSAKVCFGSNSTKTYTMVPISKEDSSDGGREVPGDRSNSATISPYGPVRTPGASASASGTSIDYSWTEPSANGREVHLEVTLQDCWSSTDTDTGVLTANTGTARRRRSRWSRWIPRDSVPKRSLAPPPPRTSRLAR
ncbi:MAG: Ig-like domain-containing protein [Aeromicrobium sp.]|uniref:Ig-like domain-containing protein n=1 Tax=Aeromicrobium sp. TaxID=1871063 RepID=UPI0039E55467